MSNPHFALSVGVSTILNEQLDDLGMVLVASPDQGRETTTVFDLHIGLLGQKQIGEQVASVVSCVHERRPIVLFSAQNIDLE